MATETIVDIYCHIMPEKFSELMSRIAPRLGNIAARLRGVKKLFDLSDGHMTTHMRELLGSEYVRAEKLTVENKSRTIYHITPTGQEAFIEYVSLLKKIISLT